MNIKSLPIAGAVSLLLFFFSSCSTTVKIPAVGDPAEPAEAPVPATVVKESNLGTLLNSVFRREEFRNTLPSMIVVSGDYGDTLYSYNSDLLVRPASNQKIITSAAALMILGKNYGFRTVVYRAGEIVDGTLMGDLIVKGYGDPLLRLNDLSSIAEAIRIFGIRSISGDIIVDDFYFDDISWPSGWMWDDAPHSYAPNISALSVNGNLVRFTIGRSGNPNRPFSVSMEPFSTYIQYEQFIRLTMYEDEEDIVIIPDRSSADDRFLILGDPASRRLPRRISVAVKNPALFTGYLLNDELNRAGITTRGIIARKQSDPRAVPMVQINTPLDSVLYAMNKESDNLAAESLWKTLSAEYYGAPGTGTGGSRAAAAALRQMYVDGSHFNMVDGSGVSFYNLLTVRGIAEVLLNIYRNAEIYKRLHGSLSVMGKDGTLKRRGVNTSARERIHGKTGTLTGVSTLSGYAETISGETLVFSISFQNFTLPASKYRAIQDELCHLLFYFNRDETN